MSLFVSHITLSITKEARSVSCLSITLILLIAVLVNTRLYSQEKTANNSLPGWIADKYGVQSFSNVTSISFTFNDRSDVASVKRSWVWEPNSGKVIYKGPDKDGKNTEYAYNRNQMDTTNAITKFIDPKFVNDQYWLLFPFHLLWDKNIDITLDGKQQFPLSKESGNKLIVTYRNNTGITPNDVFELFLDDDNMIKEWIYKPGGNSGNQKYYTWEGNKNYNGIILTTEHYGPDNKTKIWFTDIKIETDHIYR